MALQYARDLMDFIDASPSQFHAVKEASLRLSGAGFQALDKTERWRLEKGGKYYITNNSSALIAFVLGEKDPVDSGFRLIGSHTDSPTFKVKPNPEILAENSYFKLNVEMYGGALASTWFDRELSLAGRVTLSSENPLQPEERLVKIDRDLLVIPSLCIHMNREANEKQSFNKQTHLLPLLGMLREGLEKDGLLLRLLAEELKVEEDEILGFELYLYNRQNSALVGIDGDLISAGKLDNLAMFHAGLSALIGAAPSGACKVMFAGDNEEVGSMTRQGANSPMLKDLLERIVLACGFDREDYHRALGKSFMISADMAHAVHPNYADKSDPTNRPILNGGPVIKMAANCSYTTDAFSEAVFKELCNKAGVPFQIFVNRSDMRGGSTIGPINSQNLDIPSVDVGNALLGMHSVRELGGAKDHEYMIKVFEKFYSL